MRALIAGHWNLASGAHLSDGGKDTLARGDSTTLDEASLSEQMQAFTRGFVRESRWDASPLPFGEGEALLAACAQVPTYRAIPLAAEETSTRRAGQEVLRAWEEGLVPVVEGGHLEQVDAGFGFLEAVSGCVRAKDESTGDWFERAVQCGRRVRAGRELIVAASTRRPLLGPSSTLALLPDLTPRAIDSREMAEVMRAYDRVGTSPDTFPLVMVEAHGASGGVGRVETELSGGYARLPGAGAAGGVGAAAVSIGGQLMETGTFLAQLYDVDTLMSTCDLLVVWEPDAHSPILAERCLETLTSCAAQYAIPVVLCAQESSLSSHERAQWGIHGIVERRGESWEEYGRRVARTWAH